MATSPIDKAIEARVGEVRTDALDLSYGEIISLYNSKEFVISPDFQRLFRWSDEQRSRLIESVLLQLPIPQIFVIENMDGVLELVDGLQRLSSVIQFIQSDLLALEPLRLDGCDLIPELNNTTFDELPTMLRLQIKRSTVRAIVIRRQSSSNLRYAMFKRLNTGGSELSEQEIRNCTSRMVGMRGVKFYEFLIKCAKTIPSFVTCTTSLSDTNRDQRGDEELVLRFLALKNGRHLFKKNVNDWLDDYMESVIIKKQAFKYKSELDDFTRLFDFLDKILGEYAFVRFRGTNPIGGLAPAHYEAITLGTWENLTRLQGIDPSEIKDKFIDTIQSSTFSAYVGPGSNSLQKFNGRIQTIDQALKELVP